MIDIETKYLFSMAMQTERQPFGRTPLGERSVVIVTEATITGPRLTARLLPGGSDWITETPDGTRLLDCRLVFQTSDGAVIGMTYRGQRHPPAETQTRMSPVEVVETSPTYHRVAIFFETAAPRYMFLNRMLAIGRAERGPAGAVYEVFEVL